jgi:hypothetical protein
MKLKNKVPFGNFVPGDEVEVPDGALYDKEFFEEVQDPAEDISRLENDGAPAPKAKGGK